MKNRIKKIRMLLNLSQAEFGARLNLSQNYIWMLENGNRFPSGRTISDICREFNVREEWLRTGEGEMYQPVSEEEQLAAIFGGMLARGNSAKQRFLRALALLPDEYFPALVDAVIRLADELSFRIYEGKEMNCPNVKECICPKITCPNHGQCCACVIKHRTTDSLPYCLFPDNGGDKSNRNHYEVLKKRFESEK